LSARLRGVLCACLLAAALAMTGCAPRPSAQALDRDVLRGNFQRLAAERAEPSKSMQSSSALWLETSRAGHWPGVMALLRVSSPDRVRLVVRSPLGPLLDLAGAGEHLLAVLPRRHAWCELDRAGDTLGVGRPVDLAVAIVTASWSPPVAAWDASSASAGQRRLAWSEATRHIDLAVDGEGLPRQVRLTGSSGASLIVNYESYTRSLGTRWPARFTLVDSAGQGSLRCRIDGWSVISAGDATAFEATATRGQRMEFSAVRALFDRLVQP
jgi:hypothetical protein